MKKKFEAVYEDGVLRPLESIELADRQRVRVSIADMNDAQAHIPGYFEADEWEAAKCDDISLEDVRRALSSIRGSLSGSVIDSREERL